MATPQIPALVLGVVFASLFAGIAIAKKGSAMLDKRQFDELKAMGPDPVAQAAPVVIFVAAYFGARYPLPMALVIVAAAIASLYRVPYRFWCAPWPLAARLYLVIGNSILHVGYMSGALLYIAQRFGPTAL